MRFIGVNDEGNVDILHFPLRDLWRTMFMTARDVEEGEFLTVNASLYRHQTEETL